MIVKLRILRGKLQTKQGKNVGADLEVRGPRFVIGNAADCSLRCPGKSVSSHHCEIRVEGEKIVVRDLYSENGTYVNDVLVDHERPLSASDRLRVGRLEFEVLIDLAAPTPPPQATSAEKKTDPVADLVSDMLVEADEEDRARRLEDPEKRQFQLGEATGEHEPPPHPEEDPEEDAQKKTKKPPAKKPPGKLPTPPPFTADDTVSAAEETLKKLFTKGKK